MKTFKTLIFILSIALLFSACSNKKSQSRKYFRLAAAAPITAKTAVKPITLVVKRPRALSILGGRPIVATQADNSLVQLSHNFWLESPKVLLQDRIKQWAEHHWQTVSYQTPSDTAHQILETRILAFEKNQNQAVADIEFLFYDEDNRLIYNQQIHATEELAEDNYKAFVKAMSLAIESIFNQMSDQLHHVN